MCILMYRANNYEPRLGTFLEEHQHRITDCLSDEHLDYQLSIHSFRLIILVLQTTSHEHNVHILRRIQSHMNDAPIICILDRYQPIVYRELLLSGADFCLIEPLNKMDLLSLITAQMKRYRPIEPEILQIADLSLDTRSKTVTRNGKHIRLKKKEVLLLEYFLKHNNQVLSRSQLISQIWDQSIPPSSNVVDVHISSLRKKIDEDFHPKLIKTVHGFGYKIDEDEVNEED